METDLLFTQGFDLPGFASYPLLETTAGRRQLRAYYEDLIALARDKDVGAILEAPTWVANRDRGAQIGYEPATLVERNTQAVAFLSEICADHDDVPVLTSGNVGPRADAYAPTEQMNAAQAEAYHIEQINVLAQAGIHLISAYTIAYTEEAIGIVNAARQCGVPVVVAFTVETDGRLPTGVSLGQAIKAVDNATDGYSAYFMINCAHPDHFQHVLSDASWMARLKGLVVNASRCSHAELDQSTKLDDGDPVELGQQLAALHRNYPNIRVLGGCCGTDMRHMAEIASAFQGGKLVP
ncbi:homocysteine S-methyltransferase family protein [Aliiroseovarius sp. F20344]|uniref:homocysteine S-methyltransferase family protein n=1 Tax=Aliiroseovarius sp. F20344 TaxID=2926414 RepID=UPI001FF6D592|nr:homocysteine S-methyltransferase family protein [Aliiroseovarius sp. F20344]MCK0142399.1 homocysteine S-methyltransferase family protein [Aliiroseovarius sp. F20344]